MRKIFNKTVWEWWELKVLGIGGLFLGCAIGMKWSIALDYYFNLIAGVGVIFYLFAVYLYLSKIFTK